MLLVPVPDKSLAAEELGEIKPSSSLLCTSLDTIMGSEMLQDVDGGVGMRPLSIRVTFLQLKSRDICCGWDVSTPLGVTGCHFEGKS